MADVMVEESQKWLNKTYSDKSGYTSIPVNGKTGWTTIYALRKALQIELGITQTSNNFGPTTIQKFKERFPNGIIEQQQGDSYESNIYGIIQCACWCKGYSTGSSKITKHFYGGTGGAISELKKDAGIENSSTVTLNVMKSLLSMDYFYSYDNSTRVVKMQEIQRYLNRKYSDIMGLIPCDGIYNRATNKGMIYALQYEEGIPIESINGNMGPSTKRCLPCIPYKGSEKNYNGLVYSTAQIESFIKLLNIGLYINKACSESSALSNIFNADNIKLFQKKYGLEVNGVSNLTTWLSLFISCGDKNRTAKACDCATILTEAKAKTLYENGYRYVGRYLSGKIVSGASKALSRNELQIAFNAGLRIFPIQQGNASYIEYFTTTRAVEDVNSAYDHAIKLGIPTGTVIYFAVDCDPQETDIISNILPYFKTVYETMRNIKKNKYQIGIYGTRNVCTKVSGAGYAVRSFVSDMSTGFSGNLGFLIPDNWAFDQFATVTVGDGEGQIEIDKDGFSGRDNGIGYIVDVDEKEAGANIWEGYDNIKPSPTAMINRYSEKIPVYSYKEDGATIREPARTELVKMSRFYNGKDDFSTYSNKYGIVGRCIGYIEPGEFYIRFICNSEILNPKPDDFNRIITNGDTAHKVLFRDSSGILKYGYIQEYLRIEDYNQRDSKRPMNDPLYYFGYDPKSNKIFPKYEKKDENGNTIKDYNFKLYEFVLSRDLKYIDVTGKNLGVLTKGTKVRGVGGCGANYHDYIYFEEKFNNLTNTFEKIDLKNNKGAFIHLDMSNGVSGKERALW